MPMIAEIPTTTPAATGWAFAAIVNGSVIAVRSLCAGEVSELAAVDSNTEIAEIGKLPQVIQARAADEAAWTQYEESGFDDEAVNYNAFALKIRFGMVSGGEFTHSFSKSEAKRAGLPKGWQ